jgi:hypothetical protein
MLRIRIEDKGPGTAVRWRGVPGRSDGGARDIVLRAGFLADGVEGFAGVVAGVPRAAR